MRTSQDASVEFSDPSYSKAELSSYQGYHALVPMLLGLSVPLTLFLALSATADTSTHLFAIILLTMIAVSTGAIFVISLLVPGQTLSVRFDSTRKSVEIVRSGTFAHSVYSVPFSRVESVRMDTVYDDDGYAFQRPLLTLRPHETIELPQGTTTVDIAAARRVLGLN